MKDWIIGFLIMPAIYAAIILPVFIFVHYPLFAILILVAMFLCACFAFAHAYVQDKRGED